MKTINVKKSTLIYCLLAITLTISACSKTPEAQTSHPADGTNHSADGAKVDGSNVNATTPPPTTFLFSMSIENGDCVDINTPRPILVTQQALLRTAMKKDMELQDKKRPQQHPVFKETPCSTESRFASCTFDTPPPSETEEQPFPNTDALFLELKLTALTMTVHEYLGQQHKSHRSWEHVQNKCAVDRGVATPHWAPLVDYVQKKRALTEKELENLFDANETEGTPAQMEYWKASRALDEAYDQL